MKGGFWENSSPETRVDDSVFPEIIFQAAKWWVGILTQIWWRPEFIRPWHWTDSCDSLVHTFSLKGGPAPAGVHGYLGTEHRGQWTELSALQTQCADFTAAAA